MISIGRADQLAVSHRYIIGWTKTLEAAITEQQKIFVKRGSLDPSRSKLGYHLVQMPSDKMAAMCVIHLMKHLFAQFSSEIKNYDVEYLLEKQDGRGGAQVDQDLRGPEIKMPAVKLFQELGKLFDAELKEMMSQKSGKKTSMAQHLLVDDH